MRAALPHTASSASGRCSGTGLAKASARVCGVSWGLLQQQQQQKDKKKHLHRAHATTSQRTDHCRRSTRRVDKVD
jgi:hypothetical protein